MLRITLFIGLALMWLAAPAQAQTEARAELKVLIGIDPSDVESLLISTSAISSAISGASGLPAKVIKSNDLGNAMRATRTGEYDIFIAPAHVAASALSHSYELVGSTANDEEYQFVGRTGKSLVADFKGSKLYLTQQDSMAAYVARGILNDAGLSLKTFGNVMYRRTAGAGLFAIETGLVDATVAKRGDATLWLKNNPGKGVVVLTSKPVPGGFSVVVRENVPPAVKTKLIAWLRSPAGVMSGVGRVQHLPDMASYKYVAALGNFTPAQLPGATRVTAIEVGDLIKKGAQVVDVRSDKECRERRIRGALCVPYVEKSLKDVAFDSAADDFSGIAKLDMAKTLVFACNGAECWKSYKASQIAVAKGFKNVYWFRGGLPEWLNAGMPVDTGA